MAIVEMKRIDLLAMRQDQRKLLRTLQDMGCVEITPLQDEALAEYRTRDDGRLEQVDALLARLSWVIHECAAYNHQPAPFMAICLRRPRRTSTISRSRKLPCRKRSVRRKRWKSAAANTAAS